MKRVFCFTCQKCEWLYHGEISALASATAKHGGYCPLCGHKIVTYAEHEGTLWRFNEKTGDWTKVKDQSQLELLKELSAL